MSPRARGQGKNIANAGQSYRRNRNGVENSRLGESRFSEIENGDGPAKGGVEGER